MKLTVRATLVIVALAASLHAGEREDLMRAIVRNAQAIKPLSSKVDLNDWSTKEVLEAQRWVERDLSALAEIDPAARDSATVISNLSFSASVDQALQTIAANKAVVARFPRTADEASAMDDIVRNAQSIKPLPADVDLKARSTQDVLTAQRWVQEGLKDLLELNPALKDSEVLVRNHPFKSVVEMALQTINANNDVVGRLVRAQSEREAVERQLAAAAQLAQETEDANRAAEEESAAKAAQVEVDRRNEVIRVAQQKQTERVLAWLKSHGYSKVQVGIVGTISTVRMGAGKMSYYKDGAFMLDAVDAEFEVTNVVGDYVIYTYTPESIQIAVRRVPGEDYLQGTPLTGSALAYKGARAFRGLFGDRELPVFEVISMK
jgi:hypothetical protein